MILSVLVLGSINRLRMSWWVSGIRLIQQAFIWWLNINKDNKLCILLDLNERYVEWRPIAIVLYTNKCAATKKRWRNNNTYSFDIIKAILFLNTVYRTFCLTLILFSIYKPAVQGGVKKKKSLTVLLCWLGCYFSSVLFVLLTFNLYTGRFVY